jgi:hypothetical protein
LDMSQDMSTLADVLPLNPSSLPVWPKATKSVMEAMHRRNFAEGVKMHAAQAEGRKSAWDRSENAFINLRVTIMTLSTFVISNCY